MSASIRIRSPKVCYPAVSRRRADEFSSIRSGHAGKAPDLPRSEEIAIPRAAWYSFRDTWDCRGGYLVGRLTMGDGLDMENVLFNGLIHVRGR